MTRKSLTRILKNSFLAGALAVLTACGGGGSGPPPPPPPQPSYSQTATLVRDVDVYYAANFAKMNNPVRSITHNSTQFGNDLTLPISPYSETLPNLRKGSYVFTLRTTTPNVFPISLTRDVPNYTPASNFSSLGTNLNERYGGSSKTFDLESLLSDKNFEDRPVPLSSARSIDGKTQVSLNGYNLTITAAGVPGSYQVEVNFGSDSGGRGSGIVSGQITAVPEQIAFFSTRDQGTGELYTGELINNQLANIRRLTNNIFNDIQPAWSPNTNEMVFVSNRDLGKLGIWKMSNFDGSDQAIKLTPNNIDAVTPVWCADPTNLSGPGKIYFGFKDDSGKTGIASINPDGTGLVRLVEEPFSGVITENPTCSTSGLEFSFSTSRDGNSEIYIANINGSNQRNLTNNPNADDQPRWSSDNKIVFVTDRDTPGTGELNFYLVNPDSTGLQGLTNLGGVEVDLSWSPDSSRFVFTNGPVIGPFHIYLMNRDGTGLTQLTTQGQNRYPAWRPK